MILVVNVGLVLSGKYPIIKSDRQVILRQSVEPGASITLLPQTYYRYAMIFFLGDGGDGIRLYVKIGTELHQLDGNHEAIGIVTDNYLEITATNTSAVEQQTPTINISYIIW